MGDSRGDIVDSLAQSLLSHYRGLGRSYPSEHLVRMVLGSYPRLTLRELLPPEVDVCEVGFGDGRQLALFRDLGWHVAGCEISEEIVSLVAEKFAPGDVDLRVGFSDALPFDTAAFDLVVSWNSCYYLRDAPIARHVSEYARVLRPQGIFIASVPMPSSYLYAGARALAQEGAYEVTGDVFGKLNGARVHMFGSEKELCDTFAGEFEVLATGAVRADHFGVENDHWLFAARRRDAP